MTRSFFYSFVFLFFCPCLPSPVEVSGGALWPGVREGPHIWRPEQDRGSAGRTWGWEAWDWWVVVFFQTQSFPLRTSRHGLWFRALTHQANSQECLSRVCGRWLPVVLHWVWPYLVLIGPRQQQFSWLRTGWIDWLFSLIALWFHPFSAFSSYFLPLPFFFLWQAEDH